MKRQIACLMAVLAIMLMSCNQEPSGVRENLDQTLEEIDMELYRESENYIREFLDSQIEKHWKPGQALTVSYDHAGEIKGRPFMLFRGYEMLGEEKYLEAGLDFVDAILQTQREDGIFPGNAKLVRGGESEGTGAWGRIEDSHQFMPFTLICYAYKLTGDQKYLDAALRHADILLECQNPADNEVWMGPWAHNMNPGDKPKRGDLYNTGYMLNDFTTTNSMRTLIMVYKLTGDEKYIDRIDLLPEYMVKSNVGLGNVRGWRGATDPWNDGGWLRPFEGSLIDPRNFNRFASPLMTYFAAVTGKGVYLNMVREDYDWLKSMERSGSADYSYGGGMSGTGGWAYKYTYDGREASAGDYRNFLRPDDHLRVKVILDATEKVLSVAEEDGVEALQEWFGPRPVKYNDQQYLEARLEAARRVTDGEMSVRFPEGPDNRELVSGNLLERY